MRSYEVARGLFGFLSVLAWLIIIAGGLLTALALSQGYQLNPRNPDLATAMSMIPGIVLALIGVGMLAMSQVGRASVDTAEYTQQMLQLSRESLEVSRQSLRQSEQIRTGFEALRMSPTDRPMADYGKGLDRAKADAGGSAAPPLPAVGYGDKMGGTAIGDSAKPTGIEARMPGVSIAGYGSKATSDKAT